MKSILIVLYFILLADFSYSQTIVQKEVNPAKSKKYKLPSASNFNTWDVSGHIGLAYPYSDISGTGAGKFAFGVDVTKFLSHTFALQARLMHATLSGEDVNKSEYQFNTTIHYDLTVNTVVQFGNISFLKKIPELAFYATLGIGIVHYTPEIYIDGGYEKLSGVYSQYDQPLVEMNYKNTADLMIPIGFGAKYNIEKRYSLTAEFSYRTTNSDKLDGFYKLLSDQDDYSYFNVGFTYHLGSHSKTLQWVNPLQTAYNDLYEMQQKLDQYSTDSDSDGVANMYDKEPETRRGSKVYGDGTSVDTDRDGVPDISDVEIFSPQNTKVDARGVSVKTQAIIETLPQSGDTERNPSMAPAPEIPSQPVDNSGKTNAETLPSIYFNTGDDKINNTNYKSLDYIGHKMQDNPNVNYILSGYCDSNGGPENDVNLGVRRAEAVKNYLVEKHQIKPYRLSVNPVSGASAIKGSNPFNKRVDIQVRK
jgi:OOP family OmpA-OmpF porin